MFAWFWGLLILVVSMAVIMRVFSARSGDTHSINHPAPMEILKARYARGEISTEEFEEQKRHLTA